jgi:SAM-dependent methyltransferase
LCDQSVRPKEWVVCLNGDAARWDAELPDDAPFLLSVFSLEDGDGNIGYLKGECCKRATGQILIELDYDDELVPDAIEEVLSVFAFNRDVNFVYSNSVEVLPDGTSRTYSGDYGWRHENVEMPDKSIMVANVAFPEQAQYMRRIEWAPNHVRAFRASAYKKVGGYSNMPVGDDHDLVCRFYIEYGERGFQHIEKCLYIYHIHENNTSVGVNPKNRNAEIQVQVDVNYCNHAEAMYRRWAKDNKLLCLDLGGRINPAAGYISVDIFDGAEIKQDLNADRWQFSDNSVGVLRAYHVVEHLKDVVHFFNEAYRVLAPGGLLLIEVPSVNGPGAFGDPTHRNFFNTLTFEYFTNQQYAQYIQPKYTGRFQKARVVEYEWQNKIPVISAQLIALKGWYDERWCGLKQM